MYDKIGLALSGLGLILNIIGVSIPYWFYFSLSQQGETGTANFGLWKTCNTHTEDGSSDTVTLCMTFGSTLPKAFYAARALGILAVLATAAAIIVVCVKMFVKKENTTLLYIASPIPGLAGLLLLIGTIVFVVDNKMKNMAEADSPLLHFKLHASFGLCIVSSLLNFVSSPILFMAARAIPGLR